MTWNIIGFIILLALGLAAQAYLSARMLRIEERLDEKEKR